MAARNRFLLAGLLAAAAGLAFVRRRASVPPARSGVWRPAED